MNAELNVFSIIVAVCLGASLAAATGFRLFVPCLVASVAAKYGFIHLSQGWEWIGSWPALITFASATLLEIAAYYIPWIDNALDSIAMPSAPVVGTLLTIAVLPRDVAPVAKWTLAIIAGGGAAMAVQSKTTVLRGLSTAVTGGLANPVIATVEAVAAVLLSVLAIFLPIAAAVVAIIGVLLLWIVFFRTAHTLRKKPQHADG